MLYEIEHKTKESREASFAPVPLSTLAAAGWLEKDLENALAERMESVVRTDLLWVISQERQWQEEADILALDEEGRLFIFELKRWGGDESNLLQVVRYGQIFGQYKYEQLQYLFRRYINDDNASLQERHKEQFELDEPLSVGRFNRTQVFVVVTAGADMRTLDAIRYWRQHGLPIQALTYHVYENSGKFFLEFHAFSPDPEDYVALLANNYIVNTNVTYMPNVYKDMLGQAKAAAYYDRKHAMDGIRQGDRVFLYHTGVGICAMGRAIAGVRKADCGTDKGQEHFVKLSLDYKADPITEPEKCVRAWEINRAVGGSYRFRQTVFSVTDDMSQKIAELMKSKHANQK